MNVHIHADTSDADRELRRLEDGPDIEDLLAFEAVLQGQFAIARHDVHVRTGSLLLSGNVDSDYHHGVFDGEITFGGYAPGAVHGTVDYAELELSRGDRPNAHGTSHDFMRNIEDGNPGYTTVILEFLRGHR